MDIADILGFNKFTRSSSNGKTDVLTIINSSAYSTYTGYSAVRTSGELSGTYETYTNKHSIPLLTKTYSSSAEYDSLTLKNEDETLSFTGYCYSRESIKYASNFFIISQEYPEPTVKTFTSRLNSYVNRTVNVSSFTSVGNINCTEYWFSNGCLINVDSLPYSTTSVNYAIFYSSELLNTIDSAYTTIYTSTVNSSYNRLSLKATRSNNEMARTVGITSAVYNTVNISTSSRTMASAIGETFRSDITSYDTSAITGTISNSTSLKINYMARVINGSVYECIFTMLSSSLVNYDCELIAATDSTLNWDINSTYKVGAVTGTSSYAAIYASVNINRNFTYRSHATPYDSITSQTELVSDTGIMGSTTSTSLALASMTFSSSYEKVTSITLTGVYNNSSYYVNGITAGSISDSYYGSLTGSITFTNSNEVVDSVVKINYLSEYNNGDNFSLSYTSMSSFSSTVYSTREYNNVSLTLTDSSTTTQTQSISEAKLKLFNSSEIESATLLDSVSSSSYEWNSDIAIWSSYATSSVTVTSTTLRYLDSIETTYEDSGTTETVSTTYSVSSSESISNSSSTSNTGEVAASTSVVEERLTSLDFIEETDKLLYSVSSSTYSHYYSTVTINDVNETLTSSLLTLVSSTQYVYDVIYQDKNVSSTTDKNITETNRIVFNGLNYTVETSSTVEQYNVSSIYGSVTVDNVYTQSNVVSLPTGTTVNSDNYINYYTASSSGSALYSPLSFRQSILTVLDGATLLWNSSVTAYTESDTVYTLENESTTKTFTIKNGSENVYTASYVLSTYSKISTESTVSVSSSSFVSSFNDESELTYYSEELYETSSYYSMLNFFTADFDNYNETSSTHITSTYKFYGKNTSYSSSLLETYSTVEAETSTDVSSSVNSSIAAYASAWVTDGIKASSTIKSSFYYTTTYYSLYNDTAVATTVTSSDSSSSTTESLYTELINGTTSVETSSGDNTKTNQEYVTDWTTDNISATFSQSFSYNITSTTLYNYEQFSTSLSGVSSSDSSTIEYETGVNETFINSLTQRYFSWNETTYTFKTLYTLDTYDVFTSSATMSTNVASETFTIVDSTSSSAFITAGTAHNNTYEYYTTFYGSYAGNNFSETSWVNSAIKKSSSTVDRNQDSFTSGTLYSSLFGDVLSETTATQIVIGTTFVTSYITGSAYNSMSYISRSTYTGGISLFTAYSSYTNTSVTLSTYRRNSYDNTVLITGTTIISSTESGVYSTSSSTLSEYDTVNYGYTARLSESINSSQEIDIENTFLADKRSYDYNVKSVWFYDASNSSVISEYSTRLTTMFTMWYSYQTANEVKLINKTSSIVVNNSDSRFIRKLGVSFTSTIVENITNTIAINNSSTVGIISSSMTTSLYNTARAINTIAETFISSSADFSSSIYTTGYATSSSERAQFTNSSSQFISSISEAQNNTLVFKSEFITYSTFNVTSGTTTNFNVRIDYNATTYTDRYNSYSNSSTMSSVSYSYSSYVTVSSNSVIYTQSTTYTPIYSSVDGIFVTTSN